jgi:hypothetical protein
MMVRLVAIAALCSLAACEGETSDDRSKFTIHARHLAAAPQTVFIIISNQSKDYLCVPLAEVRLGSGLIEVLPASKGDMFENRPPPDFLAGLDVGGGVQVIPPNSKREIFLDLLQLEGRQPPATGLRGKVRAISCRELFGSSHPRVDEGTFEVRLAQATR